MHAVCDAQTVRSKNRKRAGVKMVGMRDGAQGAVCREGLRLDWKDMGLSASAARLGNDMTHSLP
jgi:hypothetical protein